MGLVRRTLFVLALVVAAPAFANAQDSPPPGSDAEAADADAADAPTDDGAAGPPKPNEAGADDALDIDALRREYLTLRDRLFRSRARAAAVASAIYSTRLTVELGHDSTRFYSITRATVRLDGANVFDDGDGEIGERAPRFEGYVAPGRHTLAVRVEAVAKDDDRFVTTLDNTFSIVAPGGKDVRVEIVVSDDGDIASSWKEDAKGSYDLRMRVKVRSSERESKKEARSRRRPSDSKKRKRSAVASN